MKVVLVRYGELSLKAHKTRSKFENKLIENISKCLSEKNISFDEIRKDRGRIFISGENVEKIAETVSKIFGVVSTSPTTLVDTDLDIISKESLSILEKNINDKKTFAIKARRVGNHHFSSKDVKVKVGAYILENLTSLKVDLKVIRFRNYLLARFQFSFQMVSNKNGLLGLQNTINLEKEALPTVHNLESFHL